MRGIVLSALQRRLTHPLLLEEELANRSSNGVRTVRNALHEFTRGAWSVPEGDLGRLARATPALPEYVLNPVLTTTDGTVVGCPDGYFPSVGVAVQVHSRQHHSGYDEDGRERWSFTVEKDSRFVEHGIVVVPGPRRHRVRRAAGPDVRDTPVADRRAGRAAPATRVGAKTPRGQPSAGS